MRTSPEARVRMLFHGQSKRTLTRSVLLFWQRNRDSNPNIQSQSLLCYRYTIPLSLFSLISIAQRFSFVKGILKIYFAFFCFLCNSLIKAKYFSHIFYSSIYVFLGIFHVFRKILGFKDKLLLAIVSTFIYNSANQKR